MEQTENKKQKVGILNVQWTDNYGAVLLAYALQSVIESMGYCAEIIDYRPSAANEQSSLIKRIKKKIVQDGINGVVNRLFRKIFRKQDNNVNFSSVEKHKKFELFRNNYLNRSIVYQAIHDGDNLDYDLYVVGSDVIWKPDRVLSFESEVYFLNFTVNYNCRRIAYAASIGTDDCERLSLIEEKMGGMLQKFDCVSVREKASLSFVQKLYGRPVQWCIDPTLLIGKDKYDVMLEKNGLNGAIQEHYIYLYLFENNQEAIKLANKYSKELNLPIICQCGMPDKINRLLEFSKDDGPIEFIGRIKNADFIITDSFHGTVFSVIYRKQFVTLSRGKISIRMQDLLERLKLQERYVNNPANAEVDCLSVDYATTEEIIKEWRNESVVWLKSALTENRGGGYHKYLAFYYSFSHCQLGSCKREVAA